MPYKNPEDKRRADHERNVREVAESSPKWLAAQEATRWADAQINALKKMGVHHSSEDWKALRGELRRSRLSAKNINALGREVTDYEARNVPLPIHDPEEQRVVASAPYTDNDAFWERATDADGETASVRIAKELERRRGRR